MCTYHFVDGGAYCYEYLQVCWWGSILLCVPTILLVGEHILMSTYQFVGEWEGILLQLFKHLSS